MFLQARMILENTVVSPFGTENEMVPLIFRWFNIPDIFRYMGDIDQFPFTFDDARNYYNSHKKDTWLICEKNNDLLTPIGYTGIFIRKRHSVGIFRIAIAEEIFKGKGHAKRATLMIIDWAFRECDIRNIHLSVSGANKSGIYPGAEPRSSRARFARTCPPQRGGVLNPYIALLGSEMKKITFSFLSLYVGNKNAIELYKKVGFKECGLYKNSRYENGVVYDEILMEFQKEWFKKL